MLMLEIKNKKLKNRIKFNKEILQNLRKLLIRIFLKKSSLILNFNNFFNKMKKMKEIKKKFNKKKEREKIYCAKNKLILKTAYP